MESYPVIVLWRRKKRWGKWKKFQTEVKNDIELKGAMNKLRELGSEAEFLGVKVK